ncbi:MAG TPA: TIGR03667 family PPOX class F420-dependent oxidoreductase [Jatrophihabitantaceae bacterium]|jgi:PPOX class probable F420-dependent enzyme|nr:TIGR03667 family PPOX class F420-dependent oxidoreductase [Jatrophihabitantaceae bacterium]
MTALDIPAERRAQVEARLTSDIIAWLTTVRPDGRPDTVPLWFVWKDGVFLIYSEPRKLKLRNLEHNPQVSIALDDTKGGDDVVRFEGTAMVVEGQLSADQVPEYVSKYEAHIRRLGYGDPESFAASFSVPVVVTPTRYRRWV